MILKDEHAWLIPVPGWPICWQRAAVSVAAIPLFHAVHAWIGENLPSHLEVLQNIHQSERKGMSEKEFTQLEEAD